MKLRGRLVYIVRDILTGVSRITFEVRAVPSGIDALREADLSLTLAKWREHRSISANAYYWVLVGKISEITKLSNAAVHNLLLRRYGVPETIDGELITTFIPDTEEADKDVVNKEIYHLNTKEMARLIDGAIDEAKDLGIDTVSTEEVKRMMEDYEKHYAKR